MEDGGWNGGRNLKERRFILVGKFNLWGKCGVKLPHANQMSMAYCNSFFFFGDEIV